jgi:hypothetical protein
MRYGFVIFIMEEEYGVPSDFSLLFKLPPGTMRKILTVTATLIDIRTNESNNEARKGSLRGTT